jgi:hypothetical protein
MPFHLFGPPPPHHLLPVLLSSALAFAAGAYLVARHGVPATVTRMGLKLRHRVRVASRQACAQSGLEATGNELMFSRGRGVASRTGNTAFDDYRAATLKRLEDEAAAFSSQLEGLRHAKDRSEFETFLKERRDKPSE